MVARRQDGRDRYALELLGSGVLRMLEQAGGERVAGARRRVDDAGHEAADRVDHDQRRPARRRSGRSRRCSPPGRPMRAPARPRPRSGRRPGRTGAAPPAHGRAHRSGGSPAGSRRRTGTPSARIGAQGRGQRLGAKDHARSPAVRRVVHLAVATETMLSQVMQRYGHDPALDGAAQDALGQGRAEEVREQRHDVDPQSRARRSWPQTSSSHSAGSRMVICPAASRF